MTPCSRSSPWTSSRTWVRIEASSDENGSSSRSASGRRASARASATRCCSPPESWWGAAARARRSRPSRAAPRTTFPHGAPPRAARSRRSGNVEMGKERLPGAHSRSRASRGHVAVAVVERPAREAHAPRSARSKPAITRNSVVLPQPERPSTAVSEPAGTPSRPREHRLAPVALPEPGDLRRSRPASARRRPDAAAEQQRGHGRDGTIRPA